MVNGLISLSEGVSRFIASLVRPVVTLGFASVLAFLVLRDHDRDALVALIAASSMTLGFWFKDRSKEKVEEQLIRMEQGRTDPPQYEGSVQGYPVAPPYNGDDPEARLTWSIPKSNK